MTVERNRECIVDSCTRPARARGWCATHYQRWRETGDVGDDVPIGQRRLQPEGCRSEGCAAPCYAKGLCQRHYKQVQRHGSVQPDRRQAGECAVPGCGKPADARGWCHGHHQRSLRHGDVQADVPLGRRRQPETCTVDGCERPTNASGLCRSHRGRQRRHGDPLADVPLRSADGQGWLSHGYRYVPVPPELRHLTNGDTEIAEHRLIMARHLGRPLEKDEVVHHVNGVRTDNRIENLELWSTAHPKGQRVDDKVEFAVRLLRRYRPDLLRQKKGP